MKLSNKILTLFIFLIIPTLSFAVSQDFIKEMKYESNYQTAIKKAQTQNKPLMLVVGSKSCPWCRKMERQTLKKENIDTLVKKDFIPVIIDREDGGFPETFTPKVVPTIFFVDTKVKKFFQEYYKEQKQIMISIQTKELI